MELDNNPNNITDNTMVQPEQAAESPGIDPITKPKNHIFLKVIIVTGTGLLGGLFVGLPLIGFLSMIFLPDGLNFIDSDGVGYFIYLFGVFVGPMIPFMLIGYKIANSFLGKKREPNHPEKKSKKIIVIISSIVAATIIMFFLFFLVLSVVL